MATVLDISEGVRFYCYTSGVDMRKGIHSLYTLVKSNSDYSALSGDLFVFIASTRKSIKVLRWQREGFILYHKKLELGLYNLPQTNSDKLFNELSNAEFNALIGSVRHKEIGGELRRLAISML